MAKNGKLPPAADESITRFPLMTYGKYPNDVLIDIESIHRDVAGATARDDELRKVIVDVAADIRVFRQHLNGCGDQLDNSSAVFSDFVGKFRQPRQIENCTLRVTQLRQVLALGLRGFLPAASAFT